MADEIGEVLNGMRLIRLRAMGFDVLEKVPGNSYGSYSTNSK
jgi:hypothetical protein